MLLASGVVGVVTDLLDTKGDCAGLLTIGTGVEVALSCGCTSWTSFFMLVEGVWLHASKRAGDMDGWPVKLGVPGFVMLDELGVGGCTAAGLIG